MQHRESFFGCSLTAGDTQLHEQSVRAWDPGEAAEAFAALLRDAEVEQRGEIAVRDRSGRVVRRTPYPPLRSATTRRSAPTLEGM